MNNESTKITIITVCYNAEKLIEETVRSVLNQKYSNIEYIIVDGCSTDHTLQLLDKLVLEHNCCVRIYSEPDYGIYDAMNKGVRLATGDYINILNAGDRLHDENVVSAVVNYINGAEADIYYGNIQYCYPDGSTGIRLYSAFCGRKLYYLLGDCINHQAIFAHKSCFSDGSFDLKYRFCADRDWMIRQHLTGKRYLATDILVCDYSLAEDSASVQHNDEVWQESEELIKKYFVAWYPVYYVVNRIRNSKRLSKILHKVYEIVFIR